MRNPRLSRRAQTVVIAAACSLTYVAAPSRAANYGWTGNGANNLFTATGNWSPAGQPGAADNVSFASGFASGTDIRIASNQAVNSFGVTTATPFSISAPFGNTFSLNSLSVDSSASVTFNAPVLVPTTNSIGVGTGATVTFNNNLGFIGNIPTALTIGHPNGFNTGGTVNLNAATSLRDVVRVEGGVTLNLRHSQALGTARLDLASATARFYAAANLAQPTLVADSTLAVHQSHVTFSGLLSIAHFGSTAPLIDLTDSGTASINAGLNFSSTSTSTGPTFAGGTVNLNSLGTFAGTITLSAGNTAKLQSLNSAANASFFLRDNATLALPTLNKGTPFPNPISLGFGGGAISVPAGTTFTPAPDQITHNARPLTKSGPGVMTLTDATNLNAPIVVADGTLRIPTGLNGTHPITVNAPGNVDAQGFVQRPFSGTGSITATADAFFGNPNGAFSFAGTIDAGANAVTLLSTAAATVAGRINLAPGGRISSLNGFVLPAASALAAPSGNTTVLSPVTAAGQITGPTGTSTLTFASDLTSSGSLTGNLRLQRAFTSTGTLNAGTLTLDPTCLTTLSGFSNASSTLNDGQLRITAGSHFLFALTGTGTTTLTGGFLTALRIEQSSLALTAGSVSIPVAGTPTTSLLSSLTLAPGSTLQLANNPLVLDYTGPINSPRDRVRQYLLAQQLLSSTAITNPQLALAYIDSADLTPARRQSLTNVTTVDASAVIIALALKGDANLDGTLNADDYALLDRGFAQHASTWSTGDFNYDGTVTSADYLLLDTAYAQQQGGTLSPDLLSHRESQFGPTYVSQLLTAVPEPSLALALLTTLPLTRLRRRRA